MKVVVNKCYGGFGISQIALMKLIDMNSSVIRIMPKKEYFGDKGDTMIHYDAYVTNDKGYQYKSYMDHILFKDDNVFMLMDDYGENQMFVRTHPDLIKVVEELGDAASNKYSELKIVVIPDDVKAFEIDEYDGMESIHEVHRSW